MSLFQIVHDLDQFCPIMSKFLALFSNVFIAVNITTSLKDDFLTPVWNTVTTLLPFGGSR